MALRRLGRWGNGYIAGMMPMDGINQFYRMAEQTWQEAGRAGKPRLLACAYFALGPNVAERAHDAIHHYYAFSEPYAQLVTEHALADAPSTIQAMIERFQQIGTDELTFSPVLPNWIRSSALQTWLIGCHSYKTERVRTVLHDRLHTGHMI